MQRLQIEPVSQASARQRKGRCGRVADGTCVRLYGEEDMEIDDEIEMISRNRQGINVGQYIYEFIGTAIPMKKLHPRYNKGEENNEEQLIYSSANDRSAAEDDRGGIDPRWEALKKLKDN